MTGKRWSVVAILMLATGAGCPPTATAQTLLKRLEERLGGVLEEGTLPPPGRAARGGGGYLGLTAEDDRDSQSIRVVTIQPGSPAATAGFRVGDEILTIDGKQVTTLDGMAAVLEKRAAGAKVSFGVRRGERNQDLAVTLVSRPGAESPAARPPSESEELIPHPPGSVRAGIGATVGPISDEQREQFGLTVRRGALVTSVRRGGAAERVGLREGHVIVGVDGQRVDTPEDLITKLRGMAVGDTVEVTFYDGPQLRRKAVQLGATEQGPRGDVAAPRAAESPAVVEGKPEGRPALRVLERVLDQVARPPGGAPPGSPPAVAETENERSSLRDEVIALRKQVELLERRLRELEKRLPAELPP